MVEQLVHAYSNDPRERREHCKQQFTDLPTGIRCRSLAWPHAGNDVIILLHGIGETADIWTEIGSKLCERGYTVFALDLRGHGGSTSSLSGHYALHNLVEDVNAFIIAKDLYIRPVAIVGCGIGGAVGLSLAARAPRLVGAVACIDFAIPADVKEGDSREVMPWWSFWLGQGAEFASTSECAAFLMSSLTNVGPVVLPDLLAAESGDRSEDSVRETKEILGSLERPPQAAARNAVAMTRSVTGAASSSLFARQFLDDFPTVKPRMDDKFFFNFNIKALRSEIECLPAHLLFIRGQKSAMVSSTDFQHVAGIAKNPASLSTVELLQTGHHCVSDASKDVYKALVAFLESDAVNCFSLDEAATGGADRRPETLCLRPLPEYSTIEEAKKALGPRSIPSAEAVEEELRKLRMSRSGSASGYIASSDDDDNDEDEEDEDEDSAASGDRSVTKNTRKNNSNSGQATGLCKDPSDYFGFVG